MQLSKKQLVSLGIIIAIAIGGYFFFTSKKMQYSQTQ